MASVTVALVGDPAEPWLGLQDQDLRLPYHEFPKIILEVRSDDALSSILTRAANEFGVADTVGVPTVPSFVAFFRDDDETEYSGRYDAVVTLVDESGRAIWNVHYQDPRVTFDALLRSSRAGCLGGDAHRPYLILEPAYGNGILPSWDQVQTGFVVFLAVLAAVANAHGAGQAIASVAARARRLVKRFQSTPDVIEQHHSSWVERGATAPFDVERFIDRQPWRSEVLAPLLGCTTDEAEILLAGRGFAYWEQDGLWHPDGDADGQALHMILNHMYFIELSDESPEGKDRRRAELHQKIIEELGENGPPLSEEH